LRLRNSFMLVEQITKVASVASELEVHVTTEFNRIVWKWVNCHWSKPVRFQGGKHSVKMVQPAPQQRQQPNSNMGQRSAFDEFSAWFNSIPLVTRGLFGSSMVLSIGAGMGLVSANNMYILWPFISQKYQVWRLVTAFLWCVVGFYQNVCVAVQ
jgi:hypothetical protein